MAASGQLDTLVGSAFSPTQKTAALATAVAYTGVTADASNDSDVGLAMLAHAILLNQRRALKSKTNPSIVVKTLDQLLTKEIERLLWKPDAETKFTSIINYKTPTTTRTAFDGRTT